MNAQHGGKRAGAGRPKGDPTIQLGTRVPADLIAEVDALAEQIGISRAEALRDALEDWIATGHKRSLGMVEVDDVKGERLIAQATVEVGYYAMHYCGASKTFTIAHRIRDGIPAEVETYRGRMTAERNWYRLTGQRVYIDGGE